MRMRTAFRRDNSIPIIFVRITVKNNATDVMRVLLLICLSCKYRNSARIVMKMGREWGALMCGLNR